MSLSPALRRSVLSLSLLLPLAAPGGQRRVASNYSPEKIFIDKVVVNPKLNKADFEKPAMASAQVHP